jgi:hypothetical protein
MKYIQCNFASVVKSLRLIDWKAAIPQVKKSRRKFREFGFVTPHK